jgi:hypothetical protein
MTNWNLSKIKEGFELFIAEHGRLPKSFEVDKVPYLPSSRWLQMEFGGLERIRMKLGYTDTHFGKGEHRSNIATSTNVRGRDAEISLEKALQVKFGEIAVHTEKIYAGKLRVDFYIYTQSGQFGIDVFHTETIRTLQSNVNIKLRKYTKFLLPLFFVSANPGIKQTDIDLFVKNRKQPLPANIKVVTLDQLRLELRNFKSYKSFVHEDKK